MTLSRIMLDKGGQWFRPKPKVANFNLLGYRTFTSSVTLRLVIPYVAIPPVVQSLAVSWFDQLDLAAAKWVFSSQRTSSANRYEQSDKTAYTQQFTPKLSV